ncbi:MAG: hypothetical protein BRD29_03890 [Bacteroidetes bacterium QH_2_67_10]|nr:MAG: hypothetical protein BRD29_03890 [Bacteroidetes bacterium QH_2_67_10]
MPGIFEILILLVVFVIPVWFFWRIFAKAGYSGAWSLLLPVPFANLIVLGMLAFGDWPIHRKMREADVQPPAA